MWEDKDNSSIFESNDVKDQLELEKFVTTTVREEQTEGVLIWSDSLGAVVSI